STSATRSNIWRGEWGTMRVVSYVGMILKLDIVDRKLKPGLSRRVTIHQNRRAGQRFPPDRVRRSHPRLHSAPEQASTRQCFLSFIRIPLNLYSAAL
ncbi:MAG: hypothetical protein Q8S27_18070, partial [Hoeflea sp.]|nr:hypothetical protein [Hoeflea sp.]